MTVTGLAAAACMIMGCFLPEAVSGKDGLARLLEKAGIQVVARNLHTPWAMDFTPDGRILLTERPGRIRIVREDRLLPEAWMTLGDVDDELACGLLGLAIDPHFSSNRFVYAAYTYRTTEGHLRDRLVRLREGADGKGAVDRVLLEYGIPEGLSTTADASSLDRTVNSIGPPATWGSRRSLKIGATWPARS